MRAFIWILGVCAAFLWASESAAQSGDFDEELRRIATHFAHEPSARSVQRAAESHARIDPDRMAGWSERARWSAVMPEALEGRLGAERGATDQYTTREELALDELGDFAVDDTRLTLADGTSKKWRVSLMVRWDLSDVVWSGDELSVSSEIARQIHAREALIETVTHLYYERRKRQIQRLLLPPQTRLDAVALALEIDALTARLDGLTGGWFSEAVAEGASLRRVPAPRAEATDPATTEAQSPH